MGFLGRCIGFKTDVSLGFGIRLGFWREFSDIPGSSWGVGYGFDIIGEVGAGAELISNDKDRIGIGFSVGLGIGISPIDLSYFHCETDTLEGEAMVGKC